MTKAKIYQPARNAMQSGKAKTHNWVLEFEKSEKKQADNLIGWQGSGDTKQQIKLKFASKDEAVNYANNNKIDYVVIDPNQSKIRIKSYAENFTA
jgi:hypothetical protein